MLLIIIGAIAACAIFAYVPLALIVHHSHQPPKVANKPTVDLRLARLKGWA